MNNLFQSRLLKDLDDPSIDSKIYEDYVDSKLYRLDMGDLHSGNIEDSSLILAYHDFEESLYPETALFFKKKQDMILLKLKYGI